VRHGKNHFERYGHEAVLLRVPFRSMYDQADPRPEFCRFNSGSPRCTNGRRSPRGPTTFLPYPQVTYPAREVVEVTFRRRAPLPRTTELGDRLGGVFRPLFGGAIAAAAHAG
jgi:hypothetical protein